MLGPAALARQGLFREEYVGRLRRGEPESGETRLRPGHAERFRGLWLSTPQIAVAPGAGIKPAEAEWLREYSLELAAVRLDQVLKRLFRAMNRPRDDDSERERVSFVIEDEESFSSDASADDDPLQRERSYLRAHGKCYDDLPAMLTLDTYAALADLPQEHALTRPISDPRWPSFVAKLMALNVTFKGGHHILPKVDNLSAPFGIVPRAPLFDRAVVELAVSLPPQLRLRGSVEKWILKQAVRDLLPPTIIERPKSGMLVPVEAWFRGPLLPAARERLLDGLTPYRLFRRGYLEQLLAGKLGGVRPRIGAKIWLLVTLEAWLRTVLARRLP